MDIRSEFLKNINDCLEYEWIKRVFETAIVENDIEFMKAFNKRVNRFKYLFING